MEQAITLFKGIKNDVGSKHVPADFFYNAVNFNYDSIVGADQILYPEQKVQIGSAAIDGIYEYRFLDQNNILQKQAVAVTNGNIYKDWDSTPVLLKSGLTPGLCRFTTFKDKLYIVNGKDYPQVYDGNLGLVSEMGAPFAVVTDPTFFEYGITGTYRFIITYVTSGGEEIIGTKSNIVTMTDKNIKLILPLGYDGVVSRNIYVADLGTTGYYYQLDSIADNTTLEKTYTSLTYGSSIPAVNNECPKPYFIESIYEKLVGTVSDKYPTQLWNTDTGIDVFNLASFVDISNFGPDNTPVMGMAQDYAQIVVGTQKNLVLVDVSDTTTSVRYLRANVGVKSGYTMVRIPSFPGIDNGVMFVSSLNDVRLVNGYRDIIPNTVNDITTESWSQNIRGTLNSDVQSATNLYAEFYDYKYHLIVDEKKYVFDIRNQGWSVHQIQSENYLSNPRVLGIYSDNLYNGQPDGWIEREYASQQYKGEEVPAFIESPHLYVSDMFYFFKDFKFWLINSKRNSISLQIITNDDYLNSIVADFELNGSYYNSTYYNPIYFDAGSVTEDYRVIHVNRMARWVKFIMTNNKGNLLFRGFKGLLQELQNKES